MTLEWLKDKADKAIKTVGEAGSSLLNEAQSLSDSAVKTIKSIAGAEEAKPAASKPAESKSEAKQAEKPAEKPAEKKEETKASEQKPVEKKTETATVAGAKIESNSNYETGLIADAQAIAEAVKKTVQKDLGYDTVQTVLSTIYDYASVPIKAATDTVSAGIGKIADFAVTNTSTKIGRSVGLFDTTNENVKVVVLSDEANDRLKNAAQEMQKKAIEATSKKGGDEEQRKADEARPRFRGGPCGPKETLGEVRLNNIYDQVKDTDGNTSLTVKNEEGKEQKIEVPEEVLRLLSKDANESSDRPVERVAKQGEFSNEYRHAFTNEKGERTESFTLPGSVQIKKFDREGKLITSLDKNNEQTVLTHGSDRATWRDGKTVVEGKGYKAFIDKETGDIKVRMDSGLVISKEKGETKATVTRTNIGVYSKEGQTRLTNIAGREAHFMSASDKVDHVTMQVQENLKPGQSALLAGPGFNRIVYADATLDKFAADNSWVLKTQGKTYRLWNEDGKFFVQHNGETTEIKNDDAASKNIVAQLKADSNGTIKEIRDGMVMMLDRTTADMKKGIFVLEGENHEKATLKVTEMGTKLTAATNLLVAPKPGDAACQAPTAAVGPAQTVDSLFNLLREGSEVDQMAKTQAANCSVPSDKMNVTFFETTSTGDIKISDATEVKSELVTNTNNFISLVQSNSQTAAQPQDLTPGVTPIEVKTQPLMEVKVKDGAISVPATADSPAIVVGPDGFKNETTGTKIDRQGNVRLGHDGPTLHRDGSVTIDRDTHVSSSMKVVSGGWESSTAQYRGPISEAQAQGIAMTVSGKANAAYTKALGSVVRWSEVADLNGALSDIVSMMGLIPPGSAAYGLLMKSYSLIMQALSVAAPKAQAAEKAITAGVTEQNQIKKFEMGGWGAMSTEKRVFGLR